MSPKAVPPSKNVMLIDIEIIKELRKIVENALSTKIKIPYDLKIEEILKTAYISRGTEIVCISSFIGGYFVDSEKRDISKTYLEIDREKIFEIRRLLQAATRDTEISLPTFSSSIKLEDVLKSGYDERGKVLSVINRWIGDNCSGAFK